MKLVEKLNNLLKDKNESKEDELVKYIKDHKKEFIGMKSYAFVAKIKKKFPTLDTAQLLSIYDTHIG